MAESTRKSARKRSDPRELARFIEELSWLLKSFDGIDYGALADVSQDFELIVRSSKPIGSERQVNSTTRLLVGLLPGFFMDIALFPSNEDIVEFSQAALGLQITRWQKKSRYEIVGQIVCHTNEASPSRVRTLSGLIEEMQDRRTNVRRVIEVTRSEGRSWSEVIERLYNEL